MFHLNAQHLKSLLAGKIPAAEVHRIRLHIRECRVCARRLEEWRDDHPAVDGRFADLERDPDSAVAYTVGGLVVMPASDGSLPAWLRPRRLLAVAGVLLVLGGLAWGAWLLRPKPEVLTVVLPDSVLPPLQTPDAREIYGPTPTDTAGESPPALPQIEPLAVSDEFQAITGRDAVNRLGGPVRLISGIDPDHFEGGPAAAAPWAQKGAPLVRVVYRAPDNGRVYLDQQLIRPDSTGFRPIDSPALENGDTVFRDTGGRRSATWLDQDGYLLTLSGPLSELNLRALIDRVR